jgi:hypothetical protein
MKQAEADDWVAIARMGNLAEAGFLSELLDSKGIPSHLERRENFSAVDGGWSAQFVLRVPPDYHERALDLLRNEVADYHAEEDADDRFDAEPVSILDVMRRLRGIPIIGLFLLLGMVAISAYAAGKATRNLAPRAPVQPGLWQALTETSIPYVAVTRDGRLRRSLHYDERERKLILQIDTDDDGRFDRRREFREDSELQLEKAREP